MTKVSKKRAGSLVSEWYGHRVYPRVAAGKQALKDQMARRCPFLSAAMETEKACIKPAASSGICTISSPSNGEQQDWLVCPYRVLGSPIVHEAVTRLFEIEGSFKLFTGPDLVHERTRRAVHDALAGKQRVFVYVQDKLGGEISLSATERSPEMSFDTTFVEILRSGEAYALGKYGILEVQTMDFHGSYKRVVQNLEDSLRLHRTKFHKTLADNQGWLSDRMEGPNIANVFKRTFYQVLLKFRLAGHQNCAGCVLALPKSVWDSWQRHLGKPEPVPVGPGVSILLAPGLPRPNGRSWIHVFDLDQDAADPADSVKSVEIILADADTIAHHALRVAPEAALSDGGSADRILTRIAIRLNSWWPALTALE